MNNSFSIQRFLRYVSMHFQINIRQYIIAVVINALYAAILYTNYIMGNISWSGYTPSLFLGYAVPLMIFSATSFNEFHKVKISSRAFTLPASKLEKFLFITILNIVVLPCLVALIYGPIVSNRTFAYEVQDINQSLVEATGAESEAQLLENIAPNETTGIYTQTKYSYKSYAGIMQLCAYLVLCAVMFRRRQIFWGIIIFTVSVIGLGNLFVVIEPYIPFMTDLMNSILEGNTLSYISIAFTLIFSIVTWLKFRRLQKCK